MRIGWIGAGIMGQPMVCHLLNHGYEVLVYARHPERVQDCVSKGAVLKESIEALCSSCDVLCTMVGFPSDVREVYDQIFSDPGQVKFCIDFTTSDPELAEELYIQGKERGIVCIDAPVTGGDVGAKNGALTILVGADKALFESMKPIFECFGSYIYYCGNAGAGQRVKLANQIMIANTLQGICEAMAYLKSVGMDPALVVEDLANGAAGSKQLDLQGQKILNHNYDPGFYIKHFVKDLKLAIKDSKVSLAGVDRVIKEYVALMDQGLGDRGTQALMAYFE